MKVLHVLLHSFILLFTCRSLQHADTLKAKHWRLLKVSIITTTGFTHWMSISLSLDVGGLQPQIHCIDWTCAHFNTFTELSIIFKANWHSLTQTHTITIDRLLSSHLKNMLLMGEWGTWNHFQWDIKAALWGGLVVITPHRPVLKEAI